ncbi:MAG: hypothetical protein AB7O91_02280 [Sphingomonas sp.]
MAVSGENVDASLDRQCFALMASLAEDEDPRLSGAGSMAAQYFLGRLDAAGEIDAEAAAAAMPQGAARDGLLRRCGDAMQAGGRDFRALGEALVAPPPRPTA